MYNLLPYAGLGAAILTLVVILIRRKRSRSVWPRDTVVLHQFPRGPWAPNLSPYPIKLETYLRMSGIPYVSDFEQPMSSKGKSPWMTYNGEDVADSDFCMGYLSKKLDIDLNKDLKDNEKAISKAFQRLCEDNLYWCLILWRWWYEPGCATATRLMKQMVGVLGGLIRIRVSRAMWNQAWQQGIGRHTQAEVWNIAEADLMALSDFIGNKKFLMGAEPCEGDCSVFGMLAQLVWHAPDSPFEPMIKDKYTNLRDYCTRMKERFWPDWDQCITHGYTKKALK